MILTLLSPSAGMRSSGLAMRNPSSSSSSPWPEAAPRAASTVPTRQPRMAIVRGWVIRVPRPGVGGAPSTPAAPAAVRAVRRIEVS